jgi:hypothetical protein
VITIAMKARLREIGCTEDEIRSMTPAEAHSRIEDAEDWSEFDAWLDPRRDCNQGHDE